jgi:membrane dipeptidase
MSSKESAKNERVEAICRKAFFVNLLEPANGMFPDTYVREIHAAHVGAVNVTTAAAWEDSKRTFAIFSYWHALFEKQRERILQIEQPRDLDEARSQGKVGVILGLQGSNPIGDNLDVLYAYHKLGLRILNVAYQYRNIFADGCGEPQDSGLSKLGERLVDQANRLGILIDLSHTGRKSTLETIELSKDPVIFSHSNAKSLCNNVRNLDDEQIKAVARKGGMIGAVAYGPLVRSDAISTVRDLVDHIDYVVKLVGVDHIGIGLDADPTTPKGFQEDFARRYPEIVGKYRFKTELEDFTSSAEWPKIAKELVVRGYSDEDIYKILGGNALRIFKKVWKG